LYRVHHNFRKAITSRLLTLKKATAEDTAKGEKDGEDNEEEAALADTSKAKAESKEV
jgi:hypothetical protein